MRRLFPTYADAMTDDDLAAAYAYPDKHWLRANMVASADGAATLAGRSGGLSSPTDKKAFALLRDLCDVVLVGAGTVRAEGYQAVKRSEARIEWRQERGLTAVPAIAVVSGSLDLDPSSGLFVGATERTLVVTTHAAADRRGAEFRDVADLVTTPGEAVDIASAVDQLVERGFRHMLCEGGPRLLAEVAAVGRLDELCLTVSPVLVAGGSPRPLNGIALEPPRSLRLEHLLGDDEGMLFARYRLRPTETD
jgi:riboflavin biosynthesis pyrimidine reductase